ncbi:MFS general substrate transporter [Lentinus tigrinus ALCF2SS1-7]|uniref:MFS general substrate transporter n=1 Tax=Lentinus tigrinus ALCF2SS1-7 TaxID=1328758 RepID=UPI001165CCAE|nr:MFS general substrate transporter [Lentinus tigrinus ALCF2SS1-7]
MKWKIMLMAALVLPVFFETLDYTVVATAQVHIASVFNRLDLQSYIGTVYLLTSTVFLPLFASLADVWGRHWALQLSLAFFLVGSAISTGSQNMPTMLVGRGIAGIGSAGMMAVVRIILSDSRSLNDNNWQQTMLFLLFTIGYCVGPVIGGALTTVSFRWIFAINLPSSLVAMVLSFLILRGRTKGAQPIHHALPATSSPIEDIEHETFSQKLLRIDWVGSLLFMGAGITLLLALNWGSSAEWSSARVIACFVVSGVLYLVWVAWEYVLERKQEAETTSRNPLMRTDPMIPLQLFTSLNMCVAQYAMFVSGMVMIVMFYFIAIFFTIVGGLTGTDAGTQLLYFAPGMGGGSMISIIMLKYLRQPKPPIVLGSIIITVALGMISRGMDINSKGYVDGFLVMAGVGVGMSIGPLAIHCRFSQPEERVAVVSALGLFSRALGGTVGLAQCGAVLNAKVNSIITNMVTSGRLSAEDAGVLANGLANGLSSMQSINALPPDIQTAVKDAFQQGSRWSFISLIPWAGLSVFATLFLSNIRDTDKLEAERLRAAQEKTEKQEESEKTQTVAQVM